VSHQNLTAIPDVLVKGTAYDYRRGFSEFRADDAWTLTLLLSGPAPNLTKAGTPNGADFDFALSNSDTALLAVGAYFWEERAAKAGKSYPAASGVLSVAPDLATAAAGTLETLEAKALRSLEAAIGVRLGIGEAAPQDVIESYAVGFRQFEKMKLREMFDLRASLQHTVRNQARPGRFGPSVPVWFTGVNQEPGAPWAARE